MPTIVYVRPDRTKQQIDVPTGDSIMVGAIRNNVSGIDAECGGCLSCATCHVYVDQNSAVPGATIDELELLDGVAAARLPESRLACQIIVKPELEGLVVRIPDRQS